MKKYILIALVFLISCTSKKTKTEITKYCIIDSISINHKYNNLPEIQYTGYSNCNIVYKSNQKINIGDSILIIYKKLN